MRNAAARNLASRYSIVIVTGDELVGPEAEAHLAPDYDLHMLQTWDELLALVKKQSPDAILLDIDTVGANSEQGITALAELRSLGPDLMLVALTRSESRKLRHKAIDATVDQYFVAPINFEEIRVVLGRALEKRTAEIEHRNRQEAETERESFGELIGASEAMRRVYEAITRVADSNSTVLLRGESGTGKELVARAIVSMGHRAEKPFVSINCAALPENLIETRAVWSRKRRFHRCQGSPPGTHRAGAYRHSVSGRDRHTGIGPAVEIVAGFGGPGGDPHRRTILPRKSTSGSSPRPTKTWKRWFTPAVSARTSITAST